jgi:hypothetical protein
VNNPLSREQRALLVEAYTIIPRALSKYWRLVAAAAYEHEDAAQELAVVFASRLQGLHPFDPGRLTLTSYIFMLVESVLLNRLARRKRRATRLRALASERRGGHAELDIEALFAVEQQARRKRKSMRRQKASTMHQQLRAGRRGDLRI